jgi:hypothetical protein
MPEPNMAQQAWGRVSSPLSPMPSCAYHTSGQPMWRAISRTCPDVVHAMLCLLCSKIYILTQFNSTSLNRHLARTYK